MVYTWKCTSWSTNLCQIPELKRYFSCFCEYLLSNEFSKCLYIDHQTFRENSALIKLQWQILKKGVKKNVQNVESNDSSEDDSSDSDKEIEYYENETCSLVKCNDIAVIWTCDDFPYYIVKLKKDPFLTDSKIKDDYGQIFTPMTKVIVGHHC